MAILPKGSWVSRGVHKTEWTSLVSPTGVAGGNVGDAASEPALRYKTVAVTGTFGSSTVTIQGANHATGPWLTLNDPSSTALTFTADRMEMILENPQFIRPIVTGTGGAVDVTVIMVSHGNE